MNVKIRITYHRERKYIPTSIYVRTSDLTRVGKIKNASVLDKCNTIISELRGALQDISPFALNEMNVEEIVAYMRDKFMEKHWELDFFEWGEQYLAKGTRTPQTRAAYYSALNSLERFLGKRKLDINSIDKALLLRYVAWQDSQPLVHYSPATGEYISTTHKKQIGGQSARLLARLATIFYAAKDKYNDDSEVGGIRIPRDPFRSIKKTVGAAGNGQKSLGVEVMQRIISAEAANPNERIALDIFILSFTLMGANLADLYPAKSSQVVDGVWHYNRSKTRTRRTDKSYMSVVIPECAKPYIARLQQGARSDGAWWLTALHNLQHNGNQITGRINRLLHGWATRNGLQPFTFYAARHSWATIARSSACGVEKATVDECLCHVGDYSMTDIYAERDWTRINAANAKVLLLFRWEG